MGLMGDVIKVRYIGDVSSLLRANAQATHSTGSLGSKMASVAKAGALALAAAGVVLAKGLYDATKAAVEDQASQAKLAETLRRNADATDGQIASVEDWISAQGRAKGVTDEELRPALQRLVEATHNVGEAQRLASLAMDVSAATGKSLKSVSEALMKAHNGNVGALGRLGIATKDAEGNTLSFDQAVAKMSDTFKGQASVQADTLQGKMNRLKVMFDEAKESIGYKLIPVVTKLADFFLDKVVPAAQKLSDEIGQKLGPVMARLGDWIKTKLWPALQKAGHDLMPTLQDAMDGVRKAFHDAQPFLSKVGDFIVKILIPGIVKVAQVAIPMMVRQWQILAKILSVVAKAAIWLWNNAFQPVLRNIVSAVAKVMLFWGKMFQLIGRVPGFGWVGNLGDRLVGAAGKANALSGAIVKIPNSHNTRVTVDTRQAHSAISGVYSSLNSLTSTAWTAVVNVAHHSIGKNARGTGYWRGGWSWVGEEGPELVNLPRGSQVMSHTASMAAARAGGPGGPGSEQPLQVNLYLDGELIHKSLLRVRRRKGKGLELG